MAKETKEIPLTVLFQDVPMHMTVLNPKGSVLQKAGFLIPPQAVQELKLKYTIKQH